MRVIALTLNKAEFVERGLRMGNFPVVCQLVTRLCHVLTALPCCWHVTIYA